MSFQTTTLRPIGQVETTPTTLRPELLAYERPGLWSRAVDAGYDFMIRNKRKIATGVTLAALSLMALGCTSDKAIPPQTTGNTSTTTVEPNHEPGENWGPSLDALIGGAEPTGYTSVDDGETGVAFHCFGESRAIRINDGWSYNRIAQIGLSDTVVAIPGTAQSDNDDVAYQPYEFAPGELDTVATRLQDAAAAINGGKDLLAGDNAATFGFCVAAPYTLGTGGQ